MKLSEKGSRECDMWFRVLAAVSGQCYFTVHSFCIFI